MTMKRAICATCFGRGYVAINVPPGQKFCPDCRGTGTPDLPDDTKAEALPRPGGVGDPMPVTPANVKSVGLYPDKIEDTAINYETINCTHCEGTGNEAVPYGGPFRGSKIVPCRYCGGTGKLRQAIMRPITGRYNAADPATSNVPKPSFDCSDFACEHEYDAETNLCNHCGAHWYAAPVVGIDIDAPEEPELYYPVDFEAWFKTFLMTLDDDRIASISQEIITMLGAEIARRKGG